MSKNVIEFYCLASKLKDIIREGWKMWHISASRLESVAEHVYGTMMLAIAMHSEFDYKIDLKHVVFMLAVHEMEEVFIGDITPFSPAEALEKKKEGKQAVARLFKNLGKKDAVIAAIDEYEERKTAEAKFAFQVDKLQAGLQCKQYDLDGYINPNDSNLDIVRRHNLEMRGFSRLSDSWLEYCIEKYGFDENFISVARAAREDKNWD